jgi:hypothetical protein
MSSLKWTLSKVAHTRQKYSSLKSDNHHTGAAQSDEQHRRDHDEVLAIGKQDKDRVCFVRVHGEPPNPVKPGSGRAATLNNLSEKCSEPVRNVVWRTEFEIQGWYW